MPAPGPAGERARPVRQRARSGGDLRARRHARLDRAPRRAADRRARPRADREPRLRLVLQRAGGGAALALERRAVRVRDPPRTRPSRRRRLARALRSPHRAVLRALGPQARPGVPRGQRGRAAPAAGELGGARAPDRRAALALHRPRAVLASGRAAAGLRSGRAVRGPHGGQQGARAHRRGPGSPGRARDGAARLVRRARSAARQGRGTRATQWIEHRALHRLGRRAGRAGGHLPRQPCAGVRVHLRGWTARDRRSHGLRDPDGLDAGGHDEGAAGGRRQRLRRGLRQPQPGGGDRTRARGRAPAPGDGPPRAPRRRALRVLPHPGRVCGRPAAPGRTGGAAS